MNKLFPLNPEKSEHNLRQDIIMYILLLPELQSKSFFYKMFLTFPNESKIGFENRKWDDQNWKWNYYSYFLSSNQKASFTKCF